LIIADLKNTVFFCFHDFCLKVSFLGVDQRKASERKETSEFKKLYPAPRGGARFNDSSKSALGFSSRIMAKNIPIDNNMTSSISNRSVIGTNGSMITPSLLLTEAHCL